MRFHLIDRVCAYTAWQSVHAQKLTSFSEDYWNDGNDGKKTNCQKTMPCSLALESLCQAGTWLILASSERKKRAALLSVASVRYLASIQPGDVLDITGQVDSVSDEITVLSGQVRVDGRLIMEAREIMCILMNAEELEAPETTQQMYDLLFRAGATP